MVIFGKKWTLQLRDQALHALVGFTLCVLSVYLLSQITGLAKLPLAVILIQGNVLVAMFAVGREMIQHNSIRIGWGSAFDISFFIVGSFVWTVIYLVWG